MIEILDNIPDEYLREIGFVVVQWSYLEQIMNLLLIDLIGVGIDDNKSHVIFTHMAFPQKINVLEALIEQWLKLGQRTDLSRYGKDIKGPLSVAQTRRNLVIHSTWGVKDGAVTRSLVSARGKLKHEWIVVALGEIKKTSELIEDVTKLLFSLVSSDLVNSGGPRKSGKS